MNNVILIRKLMDRYSEWFDPEKSAHRHEIEREG